MQKLKSYDDQLLFLFFLVNFHAYVERKDIGVIDISASEKQKLFITFVIARVPSSLVSA